MRVVISLLIVLLGSASSQGAESKLRTVRNNYFEVVGLDLRSVTYVNELSAFAVQIAQRYLEREGMAFPQPILISLRPEAHVDFEGDYRIRVRERNSVQLDLRWEESMTLPLATRTIAEALLLQYSIFNFGTEASKSIRAWPIEALSAEVYYGLRPGIFLEFLNRRRAQPELSLTELAETLRATVSPASDDGYWLFAAMKTSSLKRAAVVALFQQALAGIDIEEGLTAALPASDLSAETVSGQAWLSGQIGALLEQEYNVIESMDISRAWLQALASLDEPIALESGDEKLNLRSLWTHRLDPSVQELVRARYEILLLRMGRVNPAYFNPARSLGVLYEGILTGVPAHEYLHYLTLYLSDWEDAKRMQAEVEDFL